MPVDGIRENFLGNEAFCHSPESWKELWDGILFEKGTVNVEVSVKLVDWGIGKGIDDKLIWTSWSVTRV